MSDNIFHCVHTVVFIFVNTGVLHVTTVIYGKRRFSLLLESDLLLTYCFYIIMNYIKLFNLCDAQFDLD